MARRTPYPVLIVLALAFLALAGPTALFAQETTFDTALNADARLRSGPGVDWRILTVLPAGTAFRADGRAPGGGWVRGIAQDSSQGWLVDTAVALTPDQIAALPSKWIEDPYTGGAPAGGAPPAADAPPADAAPAAPVVNTAPVRGFQYGGHIAGLSAPTVSHMRAAGMTWVKRQVRPFQDYSGVINEAHANGFRILLGVVGNGNPNDDGFLDAYAGSVAQAAAQGADAIEVWNEPNIDREWPAGTISPERYTELLRRAYSAIKAANPATLVISGAPAPTGFFGGCGGAGCDDNLFVQRMAAAGAANYMDCVGIHYNEGIVPPNQTSGDPRGNSGHYSRYFWGMVNTYSDAVGGRRPLCFTELGFLSPEGYGALPGAFGWAENTSQAEQAQWVDQAVTLAARSGKVRLVIIWNVDFTEYGADPMAGYAIIRPGGGCPACDLLGS
ncbi:MAG: hypothetical protein L6Q98_12730 [Anaerolineae bacterium]|nr:hypothetical protein [Anaerolineae bacterium]NUQ05834.1 hypothetical protein [Anaerolineae bacterium]